MDEHGTIEAHGGSRSSAVWRKAPRKHLLSRTGQGRLKRLPRSIAINLQVTGRATLVPWSLKNRGNRSSPFQGSGDRPRIAIKFSEDIVSEITATGPNHEFRLAKAVGVLAITASAICAEYGSGINYVSVQSLSVYPDVKGFVPLAVFVCGIAMLPKAYLFAAFSRVMSRACSKHVWLARSLGLPAGIRVTVVYWAIGPAGAGFLAYAFGTFLGNAMLPLSPAFAHFGTRDTALPSGAWE